MLGDTLFFTANDGIHGRELWRSDGTRAGTVLVKNIKRDDSARRPGSSPSGLTAVGDTVFFSADDGTRGRELWRTDGTRAGTVLVKNIHPRRSADPDEITPLGSGFFFTAADGAHGHELWKSDGSRAGTVLVKAIAPPLAEYYYGAPSYLTARGRRLFFTAGDGRHGVELWRSNGTRAGTVMVKNIDTNDRRYNPEYPTSSPDNLTALGGRLFFTADDGVHGREMWKSDGSRVGTKLVKDIDERRQYGSYPSPPTQLGDTLFFTANDGKRGSELWKSDGSRAGTVLVKNINPNDARRRPGSDPSSLTVAGDRLFFVAYPGRNSEGIWKSDGSRAGTVLVKNVDLSGEWGYPGPLAAVQDRVFFSAESGTPGLGLWTSDGSTAGTVLVKDFDSCDDSDYAVESSPSQLTAWGSRLFFAAEDAAHGEELWRSDGTPESTVLVKDIRAEATP